jgi:hypothetical protein
VIKQKDEGIVNRSGIDNMVVVEDEHNIVREGGELVDQRRQDRFGRRWLRGLKHTQQAPADSRRDRLQRGDEVRQKAREVVIPFVQRQPGGWSLAVCDPRTDQCGFAKAGGG